MVCTAGAQLLAPHGLPVEISLFVRTASQEHVLMETEIQGHLGISCRSKGYLHDEKLDEGDSQSFSIPD